jgi:hypothetical protein
MLLDSASFRNRTSVFVLLFFVWQSEVWGQAADSNDGSQTQPAERRADDLAERLLRGETANSDIMARIIEQMATVERRLSKVFDAGVETQRLQRQIADDLDSAIRAALRRRSNGSSGRAAVSDKRRRLDPTRQDGRSDSSNATAGPGQTPDEKGSTPSEQNVLPQERFRELRLGWGHLPQRDRDEVIQGATERSLEKFRKWIERYYEALADEDRP